MSTVRRSHPCRGLAPAAVPRHRAPQGVGRRATRDSHRLLRGNHLVFDYNALDRHTIIRSDSPIPDGATTCTHSFSKARVVAVDGDIVGSGEILDDEHDLRHVGR